MPVSRTKKNSKNNSYSKAQFKKDLKELNQLLKKHSSGGRKTKKKSDNEPKRSFTIVEVNNRKLPVGEGRYSIKVGKGSPHSAAKKACTNAMRKRKQTKLKIKVRETTAGSDKVVKCYDCSRVKRKTPIIIKYKGQKKPVTITHDTKIKEVTK